VRIAIAILCLSVFGLRGADNRATIVGSVVDTGDTSFTGKQVRFVPRSTPLAWGDKTVLGIATSARIINGGFTNKVVGGLYDAEFGPPIAPILILVPPNDTNTYTFNQVAGFATNLGTFVWTNTLSDVLAYSQAQSDGRFATLAYVASVSNALSGDVVTNGRALVATTNQVMHYGIAMWGDSLTFNLRDTFQNVVSNRYVHNRGNGGDTSDGIAQKFFAEPEKWSWPTFIWSGNNSPDSAVTNVAAMVGALPHSNYVVFSILVNAAHPMDPSDTTANQHTNIHNVNAALAAAYGARFVDIHQILVDAYNPDDPQDVQDHAWHITPSSLRADGIHLNDAGNAIVQSIIAAWARTNWVPGATLMPNYGTLETAANPAPVGRLRVNKELEVMGPATLRAGLWVNNGGVTIYATNGFAAIGTNVLGAWDFDANWVSNNSVFAHSAGSVGALSNRVQVANGAYYYVVLTISNRTAGSVTLTMGGQSKASLTASTDWGPKAASTAPLVIAPTTDFAGDCAVSMQVITGAPPAVVVHTASYNGGTSAVEVRGDRLSGNTFVGGSSGAFDTAIVNKGNTGLGYNALRDVTTGGNNTAAGWGSMSANTTGGNNTALGYNAQRNASGPGFNTVVGNAALEQATGAPQSETAVGYMALYRTTGNQNTGVGAEALRENTTGTGNAAFGYRAAMSSAAPAVTAIGGSALVWSTNGQYMVAVGFQAGAGASGSDAASSVGDQRMVFLGANSGRNPAIGAAARITNGIAIGYGAKVGVNNSAVIGGTGSDAVSLTVHGGYHGNISATTNGAGFGPVFQGDAITNAPSLLIKSNLPTVIPLLSNGDVFHWSSNGVLHLIWKDQTGTQRTNRMVP
jgi:lysophospholipase L1-like esterase